MIVVHWKSRDCTARQFLLCWWTGCLLGWL